MSKLLGAWGVDSDHIVDEMLRKYDDTNIPIPDFESKPHLLISKVRKYYMEYVIKLLSVNYENNQKLLNKNIYLPSAIWRCAKNIETNAAQSCMVVHLYRENIVAAIQELKKDTMKGKLNKKLYECLHKPPENEKKTQTTQNTSGDCTCQCSCNEKRKRRKLSSSPASLNDTQIKDLFNNSNFDSSGKVKMQTKGLATQTSQIVDTIGISHAPNNQNNHINSAKPLIEETQDSDELMMQLEKLFQSDPNDEDLFEGTLYSVNYVCNENKNTTNENIQTQMIPPSQDTTTNNAIIENHAEQIKSLDERLASLAGMLVNNDNPAPPPKHDNQKNKKYNSSKWLCEEYFLKVRLYELLDQIRETDRKTHAHIKELFINLFGEDDDEEIVSPLDETPEFVISCKERIAPWVVKLLTPYYIKGRIIGKALFKALAKHLIRLIYQCSRYPDEYEVHSFVLDFLENHKMIRCEADFIQFRIENL